MNPAKELRIQVGESQNTIGFELNGITKDEAIVILNRCLHILLKEYDDVITLDKEQ